MHVDHWWQHRTDLPHGFKTIDVRMRYYSSSGMLWPTRRRYGRLLFVFATIVCISFRSWITVASMKCLWTHTRKEDRLLQVGKRDEVAFLVLTLSCMLLIHAFNTSAWTRAISLLYEEKSVCFHLPRKLRAETRRKQRRRLATLHLMCLFMNVRTSWTTKDRVKLCSYHSWR